MQEIEKDLEKMRQKLRRYVDQGRAMGFRGASEEPIIAVGLDRAKIKPLKRVGSCTATILAVDCSTRTLKRANNWGVYLLRAAYAITKERKVDWGYEESIYTEIGDVYTRGMSLRNARLELESKLALNLHRGATEEDYLLLDGPSLFGEKRRFSLSLYEACRKVGIKLLAISKRSRLLHDLKGRDFMATAYMVSPHPLWVYYPVVRADPHEHLYGDISIIKLCADSPRVFRCDIMEYLRYCSETELLSPLTFLAEDPRCLGYPVTLYLAHSFTAPADAKLLHYHTLVEEALKDADILDVLRTEETISNFPDQLHGIKRPYEREDIISY